jgi:cell wall-associated NlpC family hydrolase
MALTGRVLAERSSLRFHSTRPRAITPGIVVAIIALTIPATLAAVTPAQPTTLDSAVFAPVTVTRTPPGAALPAEALPGSAPAFVPAVPSEDLALVDVRVTAKKAAAAIREATRPTSKALAAPKITPPKPKPVAKPKSSPTWSGSSAASGARSRVVQIALAQIGDRYVSGGTGPNSFDCSGLVRYAYASAGVSGKLGGGHSASAMLAWGRANGLTSASGGRPGDVVIYGNGSHAGIYLGNGKIVSALNPSQGIRITGLHALGSGFTAFIHTNI